MDKRLVFADSLMWVNPDSSLAILEAINRDSLQGEENLAYHALLLTQAQFRVDFAIPSDSLINFAVDYYSDNHNRELYTRALLYKGGYYEVNGNPVDAIRWYKRAEDNADTTDYRNLAQINMRMGILYYKSYASNNLDLEKFKKAYKCYDKINDERMTMIALGYMGNLYRATDVKKAISCLSDAKYMAKRINDTISYYSYLNELSLALFMDSCFVEAKAAVMECINNCAINNAMCFNAANAYSLLSMPDSARYYINKIDRFNMTAHDSMMCAFALGRIYAAEGNTVEALKQESLGNKISEDIAISSSRDKIFKAEDDQNIQNIDAKAGIMSRQKVIILWGTIIAGLLLLTFLSYEFVAVRKRNNLIKELNHNKEIIDTLLAEYKEKTAVDDENKELHSAIMAYLEQHFNSLKSLIEKSNSMKHSDFVKLLNERSSQLGANDDMSKLLIMLADDKYNNLIHNFSEQYPILNENDLKIISLISLGYDNEGIAFCTGMAKESVRTKKTRIKHKMELPMSLDAYVKQEMLKCCARKE
ncbi:MAG: hypothetical protein IK100_07100 [Muribaculaceae bacterium]|nr:hypothetical protein [Muribaculaceae bacterium]